MASGGATTVAISTISIAKSTMENDNPTKVSGVLCSFEAAT